MKAIRPDEFNKLAGLAAEACNQNGWEGPYPEGHTGTHVQKKTLLVDEVTIEFTVSLFRRNAPGFGCYWAEDRNTQAIGSTHWVYYRALSGVDSMGPVTNGEPCQGVTKDQIDDWIVSTQEMALERPSLGKPAVSAA
jgi:hypothetical protein